MNDAIRLLLVDDHAMVREMLRMRLNAELDMEVVGSADNGDDAVALAGELTPDIVLMDIDMPGQLCFSAAAQIKKRSPETRILYLSAFSNDRYIEDALASHASGYLTKDEKPEVLIDAVRRAASGMAYFSPKIQARVFEPLVSRMRLPSTTRRAWIFGEK